MPDSLHLSLWFPSFSEREIMPRLLSVMRQFPFSAHLPGIGYVAVHPASLGEPTVLERSFDFREDPAAAVALASEFQHDDYGYEFEAMWDLWVPEENSPAWREQPRPVSFFAYGTAFEERLFEQQGHLEVDFGLDMPFLYEDVELTPQAQTRVKANVEKLVNFTNAVEKNCGPSARVLWSESEENLAQKLIARLQKVQ